METFCIDARKLSVQVGHWLLVQADDKKIEVDAFEDWWSTILPDNTEHIMSDLFSFAYIGEETKMNKTIRCMCYIDPLSLPTDPLQLFQSLFKIKRKVRILMKYK